MDPYDYDRIRFILEHIFNLSDGDASAAAEKVSLGNNFQALNRVATVLENPGKSLNLGRGP